jgi:hypothetical protein
MRRDPRLLRHPDPWLSHDTPAASVFIQAPGVGAFVRALLPIRLTDGHRLTYGVWVAIHPDELQRAFSVWWAPEYADLELPGVLANPVPPWGLLFAPVELGIRDTEEAPYCRHSTDPKLLAVLEREWGHATVLDSTSALD